MRDDQHKMIGAVLMILGMLCFSIIYALYKACGALLSSAQILCFANLFSWIFILPFALKKGISHLTTHRFPAILLRTVLGLLSIYCLSKSLQTISLSETSLLNNTASLFIPLITWLIYRIKIPHKLWLGLIIGFIGIFIILRPSLEGVNSGLLFGLASGIAAAGMLISVQKIAHEPFLRMIFYYFLVFSLIVSPSLFMNLPPIPLTIWLYLATAGFCMLGAQVCITKALRYAPAHDVAPFIYLTVIFSGLIDWAIWNNKPDAIALCGMVIVILGGVITILRSTPR